MHFQITTIEKNSKGWIFLEIQPFFIIYRKLNTTVPQNTQIVLSLCGLNKSFDNNVVINNFNLDIAQGEFVTLLGASGCGKTTLLRMIAGFDKPDSGSILLDREDIVPLPPEKRHVNTVFQSYALFPHMTVFENIAFSLRLKKTDARIVQDRVSAALTQTKMSSYAGRYPKQLSGGQQQRVAMARAIVSQPRVLLLDEPLSALDARLRSEMQLELKRLQRELEITTILVTHEQDEALSLSDRVVVIDEGEIAQIGTPREIYEEPKTIYVAKFIGENNLLPAKVEEHLAEGHMRISVLGQQTILHTTRHLDVGANVQILLRPEDLRLSEDIATGMPFFPGTIAERRYRGPTLDTTIELDNGPTVQACEFFDEDDPDFDYRIGERVNVSWVGGWEVVLEDEE